MIEESENIAANNHSINNKEPLITSSDPEERKSARALRILRRGEALKKHEAAVGDGNGIDSFRDDENISAVEKQAAECASILENLLADGDERVSNIRVANDAREIARRFSEAEKKKQLLEKLEAEAALAQEKFDNISSKWNTILNLNCPLEIENDINSQKVRCANLMLQKDTIIKELKEELKFAEERFYNDLQKQLNDIKQLGERIDSQVILMKKAYRSQLELIESSIQIERANIADKNEASWSALYERRNKDEIDNIEKKLSQVQEFKEKMDALRTEHREKFRMNKIEMETEIQILHMALQELKASCLINTEKIDYNYQILKRREEENLCIKSQQRRRLNKMQDIINELKQKITTVKKEQMNEKNKADKEVQRLESSMTELQTKTDHFTLVNEKKYQRVWKMNQDKADALIKDINKIDKIIHEQILGVNWTMPNLQLTKQSDLPSIKNILTQDHSLSNEDRNESDASDNILQGIETDQSVNRLIIHIMNLIADSSGFLLEERLWPLLKNYEKTSTNLCKIDHIFSALNIQSENNIRILFKYFFQYCYCEICNEYIHESFKKNVNTDFEDTITFDDDKVRIDSNVQLWDTDEDKLDSTEDYHDDGSSDLRSSYRLTKSERALIDENVDISVYLKSDEGETCHGIITRCRNGHDLTIDLSNALNALQSFVSKFRTSISDDNIGNDLSKNVMISRHLSSKDVAEFWGKYKNAYSSHKIKLWDNLAEGLNKYLPILQSRYRLNEDVMSLRKQNSELKNLLRGHVPSSEIPKQKYLTPINKQIKLR